MKNAEKAGLGAAAAGLLGTVGVGLYGGQIPTTQLFGPTICREPKAGKKIALTYDDGPNPIYTPQLHDLFERHNARATFFLIGKWAEREPGLIREHIARGHAIGNHTFVHPSMPAHSDNWIREDLARCRDAIEASGEQISTIDGKMLMRPPYGRRRPGTLRVLAEQGYVSTTWSITCYDWREHRPKDAITRSGLKAKEGDIILLHDGYHLDPAHDRSRSVGATATILEHFTEQGYEFVTVPELVAAARS